MNEYHTILCLIMTILNIFFTIGLIIGEQFIFAAMCMIFGLIFGILFGIGLKNGGSK